MDRQERLDIIKKQVHEPLNLLEYDSTRVRDNTNCYSHAIGATYPYIKLYRIGAISNLKPIDQKYYSIEEVVSLLYADLGVLELKYEKIDSDEVKLNDNQYIIKLYVALYKNGNIGYHFIKFDKGKWMDKRRWERATEMYNKDIYDGMYPYHYAVTLKITR